MTMNSIWNTSAEYLNAHRFAVLPRRHSRDILLPVVKRIVDVLVSACCHPSHLYIDLRRES